MNFPRTILLLLILLLAGPPRASAESYAEWLAYGNSESSPLRVEATLFNTEPQRLELSSAQHPALGPSATIFSSTGEKSKIGFLGSLYLSLREPEEKAIAGPIRAELLYSEVDADSLRNRVQNGVTNLNAELALDTTIGRVVYRETYILNLLTDAKAIPILLPVPEADAQRITSERLYSLRLSIKDSRGSDLARYILVDTFNPTRYRPEANAWIAAGLESTSSIPALAAAGVTAEISDVPTVLDPYTFLQTLWVSDGQAQNLEQSFLRKLLLMGVWLYGQDSTVDILSNRLGFKESTPVLLGGVGRASQAPAQLLQELDPYYFQPYGGHFGDKARSGREDSAIVDQEHPFKEYSSSYEMWTALLLGGYALAIFIGAPVLFYNLKGFKRVRIWSLIPALAIFVSLIAWGAGRYALPRTTVAQVIEYRFAYADWPEVYVHDLLGVLAMDQGERRFTTRSQARYIDRRDFRLGHRYGRNENVAVAAHHNSDAQGETRTSFALDFRARGAVSKHEIMQFSEDTKPISRVKKDGELYLRTETDIERLYVDDGKRTILLGKVAAGELIDPRQIKGTSVTKLRGLPGPINYLFRFRKNKEIEENVLPGVSMRVRARDVNRNALVTELKDHVWNFGLIPNQLILIAETKETPNLEVDSGEVQLQSQIIWFQQIPLGDSLSTTEGT